MVRPVGHSVPRDIVDVDTRAGGYRRFTMVNDADPTETSPVNATFTEVIENELLVGHEQFEMPGLQEPTLMSVRLEFHDEGEGKTRLVLRQGPDSTEMAGMVREGWRSSFTTLDALLAGSSRNPAWRPQAPASTVGNDRCVGPRRRTGSHSQHPDRRRRVRSPPVVGRV